MHRFLVQFKEGRIPVRKISFDGKWYNRNSTSSWYEINLVSNDGANIVGIKLTKGQYFYCKKLDSYEKQMSYYCNHQTDTDYEVVFELR